MTCRERYAWRRIPAAVAIVLAGCIAASSSVIGLTPELLEKARAQGGVEVIVTLRVPPGATEATIEAVKQSVLTAIASTPHRVVHALPNFPQLVLEASVDTLRALAASPDVLRIDEPTLERPMR